MVARGDLGPTLCMFTAGAVGVELGLYRVPFAQKLLIRKVMAVFRCLQSSSLMCRRSRQASSSSQPLRWSLGEIGVVEGLGGLRLRA